MKIPKNILIGLLFLLLVIVPQVLSEVELDDPLRDDDDDDDDILTEGKTTTTTTTTPTGTAKQKYTNDQQQHTTNNNLPGGKNINKNNGNNINDNVNNNNNNEKDHQRLDGDDDDNNNDNDNADDNNNADNLLDGKNTDGDDDNDDDVNDDVNNEKTVTVSPYQSILDRIEKWVARVPETHAELVNTDWAAAEANYKPPTGIDPRKESEQNFFQNNHRPGKWKLTLGAPLEDKWEKAHGKERPFRVLWVSEFEVYTTSMSRWYFHTFESFKQLPGVEAYLWGPGFQGWDDTLTTSQNIGKRWGDPLYFDFLMNHTFKRNDGRDWLGIGTPATPVAVWHHECTYNERLPTKDIAIVLPCSHEANIVFHAYAGNMAYYSAQSSVGDRLLWHLPHAVHLPLMSSQSNPLSDRKTDVLLVGRIWSVYPLRQRFQKLIEEGRMPGKAVHYQHPGYWFPEGPDSRTPEAVEKQGAEYLRQLENAKIVLMCTSKRRYAVRKYMEAAAAGALIVADIPEEREDEFRKFVVEVNLTDPDEVLIETVRWWLDHPKERIERATLGQKIVLSKYRSDMASKSIVTAMKRYIGGQRGMAFPYPFAQIVHFLPKTKACTKLPKKPRP